MAENEQRNEGRELLDKVWFDTIEELWHIVNVHDDAQRKIEASKVLLDYFKSFGQSLNDPWIPEAKPRESDDDEDEYEDD